VFTDAVGNAVATPSPIYIARDTDKPGTSSSSVAMGSAEVKHDAKRFGTAPSFTFTPTDWTNGSGVKAWMGN
jgi:hypothetical protein